MQTANNLCSAQRARVSARTTKAPKVRVQASQSEAAVVTKTKVDIKDKGASSIKGTIRKQNEDRWDLQINNQRSSGKVYAIASAFDGHGGYAVSEYLKKNLATKIQKEWNPAAPDEVVSEIYQTVDDVLVQPTGFMGMGERGYGGSKCGSTAAQAIFLDNADGTTSLMSANVGDARILLIRNGKAIDLHEEHVPDVESERDRIERLNPNPKQPMVQYINGTWRVGNPWGYLALSRAFGDAFLKAGYTKGKGLVAEPYTEIVDLTDKDSFVVVSTDGLHAEEARGGGGGLENDQVAEILNAAGNASCQEIADTLVQAAADLGSTDDITVVVLRLGSSK